MTLPDPPVPGPGTDRLREALLSASYTADGLLDLLGATAYAALSRGESVPALRATREGSATGPLATLTRLFLLHLPVSRAEAAAALPVGTALADGWLVREGEQVRASVDVRPHAGQDGADHPGRTARDGWIVSDAAPGHAALRDPDVVLGVGGASATLAGLTVREPVRRALDLGTGSGLQALHATRHAVSVTATDVNPRALRMAALTLALSGAPAADLRQGSLFGPVDGEEPYDLIVSNPPFVISPPSSAAQRLTYRDAGREGDELCRTLVRECAARLTDGGVCQLLANWEHVEGEDWRERVTSWVPPGCDAWIVQREEQDVARYTELWLRDAGLLPGSSAYAEAYEQWLDAFAARSAHAVGLGWIFVRARGTAASGTRRPSVVAEEWPHPVEQPLGETVSAHFARQEFLRTHDDAALLTMPFTLAGGVVQEQLGAPGAEDPEHLVLRQGHGMRRARAVDTVTAAFAGSCDGTIPAGTLVDAIAELLGTDAVGLRDRMPQSLRGLIEEGFLLPADGSTGDAAAQL